MHRQGRRWVRWGAVVATAAALFATAVVMRTLSGDSHREYLTAAGLVTRGQAAYQLGTQLPRATPDQRPVPIASLAKVMTAYLLLISHPLGEGESGPSLRVTRADAADTARRRARDESVIAVRSGERLTQRQALMAILLPSANNVAVMATRLASATVSGFVARMNRTARELGMTRTRYTDPSGYDQRTVSTATDQLILAKAAATNRTLAAMMAVRSYRLPVAGLVRNTDVLLGHGGFVGMKTGSDDAAGGCFMFRSRRLVEGRTVDLIGVVLGQPGRNLVLSGQYAARQLADSVAPLP